jgi:hypothetical protein
MSLIENESLKTLFSLYIKSLKLFRDNLKATILIFIVVTLISAFISRAFLYFSMIDSSHIEAADFTKMPPLYFIIMLSALICNQVLMVSLCVQLVLSQEKISLLSRDAINLIKDKFGRLFLAILLKSMLIGISFMLLVIPMFVVIAVTSMVEYIIIVENSNVAEAFGKSYKIVQSFLWQLVFLTAILYVIPFFVFQGMIGVILHLIYIVHMMLIYIRSYEEDREYELE